LDFSEPRPKGNLVKIATEFPGDRLEDTNNPLEITVVAKACLSANMPEMGERKIQRGLRATRIDPGE